MSRFTLLPLIVAGVALVACSDSPVSPAPQVTAPRYEKQGTTSGRILYVGYADAQGLWSVNADGTESRRLSANYTFDAAWAPDGKRVVFSQSPDGVSFSSIFSMNADGTGITRLTVPPANSFDISPVAVGKQIAFVRYTVDGYMVFRMNADGTGLTAVGAGEYPSASPSGDAIAVVRNGDIWVYSIATGTATNITQSPTLFEYSPAYSPSGKRIAYVSFINASGTRSLRVMNTDGTASTPLMSLDATKTIEHVVWSPDGKQLAFSSNLDAGFYDIYTLSADGTALTNITRTNTLHELISAWAK